MGAARRVRSALKDPSRDAMRFCGTTAAGAGGVMPEKHIQQVGEDTCKKAPVGAGPHRLARFTPGVDLVLEAVVPAGARPADQAPRARSMPEETPQEDLKVNCP